MKKFWILILILIVLAAAAAMVVMPQLATTQNREPQGPEDALAAARAKMGEVSSMRFEMKMNMDLAVAGQAMDVALAMQGEMTANPAVAHGNMTVDMGGDARTEMEVYMETVNGEPITYVGLREEGGQTWSAQRGSAADAAGLRSDTMALLEIATILTGPEPISETEQRYTGVIPAEKIRLALAATGMLSQLEGTGVIDPAVLDAVGGELEDMPLTITVDQAQQYITGYSLDMTAVVRQILLASLEASMEELGLSDDPEGLLEVTGVTTEMRLYDFDLVGLIIVPEQVKK